MSASCWDDLILSMAAFLVWGFIWAALFWFFNRLNRP